MLLTSILHLLLLIVVSPTTPAHTHTQQPLVQPNAISRPVTLHLRHVHVANASHVLFADVFPYLSSQHAADEGARTPYTLNSVLQRTHRPSSLAAHAQARRDAMRRGLGQRNDSDAAGELSWEEDMVVAPDVTSRETLLMLAKMTSNAYVHPDETGWYDLGGLWNVVSNSVMSSHASWEGS